MEIHRATRKDHPAGFADVIAFPGNSDVKKDLQDLLDQIGSTAKITLAARRSYSIKPDRTPVRRPSSIEKQPSQVKRVVMIGMFLVAVLLGTAAGWALAAGSGCQRGSDPSEPGVRRGSDLVTLRFSEAVAPACSTGS